MTVWTSVTGQTISQTCHDQQGAMKRSMESGFIWLSKHLGNEQYRSNGTQLEIALKRKVSDYWESGFLAVWNTNMDSVCVVTVMERQSTASTHCWWGQKQKVLQAIWAKTPLYLYYTTEKWEKKRHSWIFFPIILVIRKQVRPPYSCKTLQESYCLRA